MTTNESAPDPTAGGYRSSWGMHGRSATPDADDASECAAIPPNVGGPVPCHLPSGHDGEHFSTSGCAGSEIRWADGASEPLTVDERTAMREAAAKDVRDPHGNDGVAMVRAVERIVVAREAAAATKARADERERIAQAIEVMPIADRWLSGIHLVQRDDAARIARDGDA